jgi:hypothetical protein
MWRRSSACDASVLATIIEIGNVPKRKPARLSPATVARSRAWSGNLPLWAGPEFPAPDWRVRRKSRLA